MGHSLGGVFGSNYAFENENIDGIILLASYVIKDFSTSSQSFLSITASEDLVLNQESYIDSLPLLPSMTTFVEIQGGNHGQFGDYGPQPKDGVATIDTTTQRAFVVNATTEWINTNFVDG
jgi:hypothetical protein